MIKSALSLTPLNSSRKGSMWNLDRTLDVLTVQAVVEEPFLFSKRVTLVSSLSPTGTNVCKENNGGCEQLCLYRGNGERSCACAHGALDENGRSCRDYAGYLLYSERTILKSVHLSDEKNLNAPVKPFEDAEHMKNVIALAFDYRGGGGKGANRIFYSDIHYGNIQQINDDGSERKTVVESESLSALVYFRILIFFNSTPEWGISTADWIITKELVRKSAELYLQNKNRNIKDLYADFFLSHTVRCAVKCFSQPFRDIKQNLKQK